MYRPTRVAVGLLFIVLCWAGSAFAQGGTGQLSGNVVDANGAVVPGAAVKLTSGVTGQEREAVTSDSGDFVFTLLPAGVYKLEITAAGFRTVVVDEVRINVTQTTTLPVRLDAATVSGMVTIKAEAPLVQQETSQVGRTVEEQTIRQLPLPTRNFQQLLTLSPGTSSSVANNTELGRGDASSPSTASARRVITSASTALTPTRSARTRRRTSPYPQPIRFRSSSCRPVCTMRRRDETPAATSRRLPSRARASFTETLTTSCETTP